MRRPKIGCIWRNDIRALMPNFNQILMWLQYYGIDCEMIEFTRINTATGLIDGSSEIENEYDGLIVVRPTVGYAQYPALLSNQHPWPILCVDSYTIRDSGEYVCGQAAQAANNGGTLQSVDIPGGKIHGRIYYYGTKSDDWTAPTSTVHALDGTITGTGNNHYYELIIDNTGVRNGSIVAWRRTQWAGADVVFVNDIPAVDGDTINIVYAILCYYLGLTNIVPRQTVRIQIDMDDVDACTGYEGGPADIGDLDHDLVAFAGWCRSERTAVTAGISRHTTDTHTTGYNQPVLNLEGTPRAIMSTINRYPDVYKKIVHDHYGNVNLFGNDTASGLYAPLGIIYDTSTFGGKRSLADANLAACRASWGDDVQYHNNGYAYVPANTISPIGARVLAEYGARVLRNSGVGTPRAVSGRGESRVPAGIASGNPNEGVYLTDYSFIGAHATYTWDSWVSDTSNTNISLILSRAKAGFYIGMLHGPNWAIDPVIGQSPVMKWITDYLTPLFNMAGREYIRMVRPDEIGYPSLP